MSAPSASGTQITLASGRYEARIVTVGAALAGLRFDGHDLVVGHGVDEIATSYSGKTLMPWPNRIAGGVYRWEGETHEVPINEASTGAALHGLMCWTDWTVIHADRDSATLGAFIAPRYGYPWALSASATYALDDVRGLTVSLTARNVGSRPAPYGVSSHPYLTVDEAPSDVYELTCPASTVLETDERLSPIASTPVDAAGMDFRGTRVIGSQHVDHAFGGLPDGEWTTTLRDPSTGIASNLRADARWVQVYTGENLGRRGVAVEPMTCPPDAFNSGDDVVVLEPGQEHTLTFRIYGTRD
ncbi:aldose-1-epimerase [Actinomyces sp. B33]|uniref:aldose-1-epimerase n=1 Tax=Actinomyces sp. B33 TaxID=2942131 RepID=UPI002340CDA6|nr:aldose-1-epimerase [Actinomyces sp. B33]MDC4232832.1 aldose-1-epimerase [Actinomyces sp. B33]